MKKTICATFFVLLLFPLSAFAVQTAHPSTYSPNQFYLGAFLNAVAKSNKGNPNLSSIENKMRQDLATTTDLVGLFFKDNQAKLKGLSKPRVKGFLGMIDSIFASIFEPRQAAAAVTSLPFGGPLDDAYYCDCSDSWLIYIGPTSNLDTSDEDLSYEEGSQAFEYYNIPFATYLLGNEEPGVPGCYEYVGYTCTPIEAEGEITPVVGSNY